MFRIVEKTVLKNIAIPVRTRCPRLPPGPRGLPFIGVLFNIWRDPLQFFVDVARKYGDVVYFHIGPQRIYLINHPDYIKHVLQDNPHTYRRRTSGEKFKSVFEPVLGQGLLVSEGELWRRQRRLVQPAFHRQRIASLTSKMVDPIAMSLERWRAVARRGEPIDVAKEMMILTLRIVGKTLFNVDIGDDTDTIAGALATGQARANQLALTMAISLPVPLPTPGHRRYQQAQHALDAVVYRIIDEHRRNEPTNDLLSTLMLARDEETGEGMSETLLRDEVMNLMLAGYETTAAALAWTWYLLARHPHAERQLHAELATILNGRPPTWEDLPNLTYTRMVIEETLRLYPPAWLIFRTAAEDDEIDGYDVPAGSLVLTSPYLMGRHTAFWEHPERFDPERFAPERSADRPRFTHFPFGGGPRGCVGGSFAMMEMQVIVAQIAQTFRLRLVPGHPIQPQPLLTLRPRHGVWVTLHEHSSQRT